MTPLTRIIPVIAGAVAGGLIALVVANGSSTKTVPVLMAAVDIP